MTIEIKAPTFPESVADGTVANWLKKEGDFVKQDEIIAEIETDKVVLEVVAPEEGTLVKILKAEGDIVLSAEPIGEFDDSAQSSSSTEAPKEEEVPLKSEDISPELVKKSGPAAEKLIRENNLDKKAIEASGKGNRVTKEDVINHIEKTTSSKSEEVKIVQTSGRPEKRVPMSRLRATIANRLLTVKQNTAMLTTFNEVDMQPY
jgi:2-oxoglutarate dehydrogenase E2 component (dihydrolipoamide succinyltransferase)